MYSTVAILLILAAGIANTLRGRAILPRWAFYIVIGSIAYLASDVWWYALIWGIGSALWLARSWGEGFSAITGRMSTDLGKNPLIEKICFAIVPDPYATPEAAKSWGFWFMTFRGLIFLYPTFIALAALTLSWPLLVLGLFSGLQGACYRMFGFVPEGEYSVACAEVLMGCTLGILITFGVLTIHGFAV